MPTSSGRFDADTVSANQQEPVFAIGPDGDIAYANDRFLAVTGFDAAAVLGEPYETFESVVADGAEEFEAAYRAVDAGESDAERVELEMSHPPAAPVPRRLPAQARLVPLTRDGEREGVLVTLRDITERKRTERRLEAQTEQLALLNRLLRHDIRNDATVISGWADLLADSLDGEARERAERIHDAATHIEELTREAGDVAKLIGEGGEMDLEGVRPLEHLREEVSKVRNGFPEATVTLDADEAALAGVTVAGNALLGSVFGNLLRNAVVHNDREEPTVEVACERTADTVVVRVADDGPGIPDDRKEEVFEVGEKGLESSGMGLGLYLASTLVDRYGGEIGVTDNEPRGTVFTVRLPVVEE